MKTLIALRHIAFELMGYFDKVFENHGYHIQYIDAFKEDFSYFLKHQPDLLVIMGGPISVNEEAKYPYLLKEFSLIKERIDKDLPTLGICLGAQMIAKVLSATVKPLHIKEIGWFKLNLSKEGKSSPLKHFDASKTAVFHWHSETFELPQNATLLASSKLCSTQAFSYKNNILALQFHPEIIPVQLLPWYKNYTIDVAYTTEAKLIKEGNRWGSILQNQGINFIEEWTNNLRF